MSQIIIDKEKCIRCNTCAAVCAIKIIDEATEWAYPTILEEKADYCMKCGHCESFCPQQALTLDFLLEEKIYATSPEFKVDPQNLVFYIKSRRSVRHYSPKIVDKELITRLVDVARYAASGGNGQPVKWIVIHDPSEVKNIARLTIDWMRTIQKTSHPLATYVTYLITFWDNGVDLISHNAPHLLFAHYPVDPVDDPTEAVIAMTHIDIAAPAFGIGTCWAGYVIMAMENYRPLKDLISVPEGRKAACPMLFGYSRYEVTAIPRRNPVEITWR